MTLSDDFYGVLSISPSANAAEIKAAYHRALLAHHPDKRSQSTPRPNPVDIDVLKQAFTTLHSPELRKAYDAARMTERTRQVPRPAQIVSLEDFANESDGRWTHPCRCGGTYVFVETMLDVGEHLVGCTSCSEVVWAGYELLEEGGQDEA
ncbi:uncharacterized protein BXZ73DRAFT_46916 [Epithele typhae]|uniref:uncharacterized protein n=1 Tax=Epithele typhae TaxID=378194 RepID=UPI0020088A7B|nr:uncharacterized protein BXZ73DRAFT_46916 [Epithele typhae]KAH9932060.1 hypothetical protein BXZ73DRAFT_46916 [Epithele typhae]